MLNTIVSILKLYGQGVIGIIIWPIATLCSTPKMIKLIFDRDISFFHTTFDLEDQVSLCPGPCLRRINRTRPSLEAIHHMEQLQVARYRMPLEYINQQKCTFGCNLFLLLTTFFTALGLIPNESRILDFIGTMGWVTLTLNGVQGFIFCVLGDDFFPSTIDAICRPIKFCFSKNPRYLAQDSLLSAAVQTQSLKTISDIVQSGEKADLNNSLIDFIPKKLEAHHKVLLEATNLPDSLAEIISQYCFSPFYIGLYQEYKKNHKSDLNVTPDLDLLLNENIVLEINDEDEKEDIKAKR